MEQPVTCPCGSGVSLHLCCARFHDGQDPPTAEALMRARYAAFVWGDVAFLRRSWDPATCPVDIDVPAVHWLGLEIIGLDRGGRLDRTGTVTFVARYRARARDGVDGQVAERSRFARRGTRWVYVAGEAVEPPSR